MTVSNRRQVAKLFSICQLAKNAARQKFITEILLALLESKNVQFNELSLHINSEAKEISTERRLQNFFAKFEFDYDVALLLCSFGGIYKLRWSIETLLQACKQRGFNLESTHLKSSEKIKKLLVFVFLAVAICINTGILLHKNKKQIKVKKHGYKANSFFRTGLDTWRRLLKNKAENELLEWIERACKIIKHKINHCKSIS
jgi:hypothetical protein